MQADTPQIAPQPHRGPRYPAPRVILALILREMSTRYGRTPGGYLWALAEPMGIIVILAIAFSLLLRSPSLGSSFVLFYATGYLVFNFYSQVSGMVGRAIIYSRPLLAYPAVSWIDAVLARLVLTVLTQTVVSVCLLAAILTWLGINLMIEPGPILIAFAIAGLLGFGVGTVNAVLFAFFPVYERAWSITTRPLMLASGVIYIYEDLAGLAQTVLWYNPLIHLTGQSRTGFFVTYEPTYIHLSYPLMLGLGLSVLGLILLRRYYRDILQR